MWPGRYTIREATVDGAIEAWAKTNAFVRAGENARWETYNPATEIEWRDGTRKVRSEGNL